jgi:hypothetical protein
VIHLDAIDLIEIEGSSANFLEFHCCYQLLKDDIFDLIVKNQNPDHSIHKTSNQDNNETLIKPNNKVGHIRNQEDQ